MTLHTSALVAQLKLYRIQTEAAAAATTTAADAAAAVGPAPKPVKPVEDLISQFDSLPLFMRELPAEGDAGPDGEGNIALEALQNLAYEGTPDGECNALPGLKASHD